MPCLSSCLPCVKPSRARFDHEPARPAGRQREDRVELRHAAVADPLLGAGDPVAGDGPVLADRLAGRLQRPEVAAGLGLGGAVGEQDSLLGDPAHVLALLVLRAADADRVAAEERRELGRRQAEVDRRHPLADAVDVERAAAHAPVLVGHEQQLDTELIADDIRRTSSSGNSSRSSSSISSESGSSRAANSSIDLSATFSVSALSSFAIGRLLLSSTSANQPTRDGPRHRVDPGVAELLIARPRSTGGVGMGKATNWETPASDSH